MAYRWQRLPPSTSQIAALCTRQSNPNMWTSVADGAGISIRVTQLESACVECSEQCQAATSAILEAESYNSGDTPATHPCSTSDFTCTSRLLELLDGVADTLLRTDSGTRDRQEAIQ